MDIQEILETLPHRYPFLLVDKVIELEEGKRAVGVKNVTVNEPFFQGHFPGRPIMPGVLICEALAQVGGIALLSCPEHKGKFGVFAGIDHFKFKKQVVPGDVLTLEVEIIGVKMNIAKANAVAKVDGKIAAMGEVSFAIVQ